MKKYQINVHCDVIIPVQVIAENEEEESEKEEFVYEDIKTRAYIKENEIVLE